MKYRIFQHAIESEIPLPELPKESLDTALLFFESKQKKDLPSYPPKWLHHWYLPNGQISLSVGKNNGSFWIDFPNIASFKCSTDTCRITAYREDTAPDESIRHLLLDQVIPRILSHRGELVIHASCILTDYAAIAFCGESGWGKSTLAAYFHGSDESFPLLTDDCLLLNTKNGKISCTASYPGARLFQDSLTLLNNSENVVPVSHYSNKKRILMACSKEHIENQISAIFILNDPSKEPKEPGISIKQVTGATAAIALLKNTFPLDITDRVFIKSQLQNIARIGGNNFFHVYYLNFPRDHTILPKVKDAILNKLSLNNLKSQ